MPALITFLAFALAVARVTRLVTEDALTEPVRARLLPRLWRRYAPHIPPADWEVAEPPKLVYLVTCPWCVSIYVAAVAAPLWYFLGSNPWVLVPAAGLSFSHLTGLLATVGK
jgi:hypothetical protein